MARITRMTKRRLGELLQAEGLVSEDQIRAALEEQRKSNLFLGEALVKLGYVSEETIAQTIVQQFNLPFASAMQFQVAPEVLNTFAEQMYYEYQFIAVDKIGRVLVIVGAGLMTHDVLDELERCSGCKVHQFVSTWKDIKATLDKYAKDFKKDLTGLGSMLLDVTPQPGTIKPLTAAPPGAVAVSAQKPAPSTSPAPAAAPAPASAQAVSAPAPATHQQPAPPGLAAAATAAPGAIAGSPPPRAGGSGLNGAVLGKPAGSGLNAAVGGGPKPLPTMTPPGGTKMPSQRLSALAGFKPPAAAGTPPAPAPAAGGTNGAKPDAAAEAAKPEPGKSPPAPKAGTGLLGLFKKP